MTLVKAITPCSAILLALLLGGCAAASPSADELRTIHSIALAPSANPMHFGLAIGDLGTAISEGLAVGPGAAAGVLSSSLAVSERGDTLTDALMSQNLWLGEELKEAVAEALRRDRFEVTDLGSGAAPSDAILKLVISQSRYERRVWGKIGPHVVVVATLAQRVTGRRLFHRIYLYDMHTISIPPTLGLTPSDRFGFDTPEEVLSHPAIVAAGFRAAIPMIASDIARTFRRRS